MHPLDVEDRRDDLKQTAGIGVLQYHQVLHYGFPEGITIPITPSFPSRSVWLINFTTLKSLIQIIFKKFNENL